MQIKTIYLAGGCYWGVEHYVKMIKGVVATEVGFANGNVENPTYEQVCSHETGFAETVRVDYDADILDLEVLLMLFYKIIDPTSLNKQGEDVGNQYRTGVYYVDGQDGDVIKRSLSLLAMEYATPIVVEVEPLHNFYAAHDAHQDYLTKNPNGYCHVSSDLFAFIKQWSADKK